MTLLLFILFNSFLVLNAFNPSSTTFFTGATGATHIDITRCAVAAVTAEYFQTRFSINIAIPVVTNGICPSSIFSQIKLAFSQIKYVTGSTYNDWGNTLDSIVNYNQLVDLFEQTNASCHFDSESFIGGSKVILTRYKLAVAAANSLNYDKSNEYFGQMTHTLQDFNSHSNWMELNNRVPQPDLGINIMTASQFAGPTVRTCTNCSTGPTAVCQSNNDITKDLTSGYFSIFVDILNKKPVGKCSHGGPLDATKDNDAVGGINKDSLESIHGYLHVVAAQTAYLATCKILRQLRTDIQDVAFGKFLNILNRQTTFARALFQTTSSSQTFDPSLAYTNILNIILKANSFSLIQQIISRSITDSYYKSHILSIATRKHLTIDIYRQSSINIGQDLAKSTGGIYVYYFNKTQKDLNKNPNDQPELIDLLYSKKTSNDISITVDNTCTNLLLEILTNDPMPKILIKLINSNQILSPSSMITNTDYYKSFLFSGISNGNWKLLVSSLLEFDVRVTCQSEFRCYSRLYVNNDNPVHPGLVELQGNLIQNHNALLVTTCDYGNVSMTDMSIKMINEKNGETLGEPFQSIYDSKTDRWVTNLTDIPFKSFRLRFLMNNKQIQRLSRMLYQPSLIDVEIYESDTTLRENTIIKYHLHNYQKKSVKINFLAKNIGSYMQLKTYTLQAGETRDDQIEFDQNTESSETMGDMLALTVTSQASGWNYDIVSF